MMWFEFNETRFRGRMQTQFKTLVVIPFFTLMFAQSAMATVVNYSGYDVDMGSVGYGQTGTISNFLPPVIGGAGLAFGVIPSNSSIVFSYSFTDVPQLVDSNGPAMMLYSNGDYDFFQGGDHYTGGDSAHAGMPVGGTYPQTGFINGAFATPLLLATADLTGTAGSTSIVNSSVGTALFTTMSVFFGALPAGGNLTYAVSSVPLPGALVLFASALLGLFGFSRRKRAKAAA
jgi:hypothetical protein